MGDSSGFDRKKSTQKLDAPAGSIGFWGDCLVRGLSFGQRHKYVPRFCVLGHSIFSLHVSIAYLVAAMLCYV